MCVRLAGQQFAIMAVLLTGRWSVPPLLLLLVSQLAWSFVHPLPRPAGVVRPSRLFSSAEAGAGSHVENLNTLEGVQEAIAQGGAPVVFRYHASWCRACKAFAPKWEQLAQEYGGAYRFCDVDITGNKEIVKAQALTVLPHIHMYKDGQQIENFSVSVKKVPLLVEKLDQHKPKA